MISYHYEILRDIKLLLILITLLSLMSIKYWEIPLSIFLSSPFLINIKINNIGQLSFSNILLGISIIGFAISAFGNNKIRGKRLYNHAILVLILFTFYVMFSSTVISGNSLTSQFVLKEYLRYSFIPFILCYYLTKQQIRTFLSVFASSVFLFIIMIYSNIDYIIANAIGSESGRIYIGSVNPITLAIPLGISVLILTYHFFRTKSFKKFVVSTGLSAAYISVIFINSIQVLITSSIYSFVYIVKSRKTRLKKAYIVILGFAIFSILLSYAPNVIRSLNRLYYMQDSITGRMISQGRGLYAFASSPIFGVGVGSFGINREWSLFGNAWSTDHVHNLYIEIMAEQGIIGFTLFSIFLFIIIDAAFKIKSFTLRGEHRDHINLLLFILLLYSLTLSFVGGGLGSSSNLFFISGMVLALARERADNI